MSIFLKNLKIKLASFDQCFLQYLQIVACFTQVSPINGDQPLTESTNKSNDVAVQRKDDAVPTESKDIFVPSTSNDAIVVDSAFSTGPSPVEVSHLSAAEQDQRPQVSDQADSSIDADVDHSPILDPKCESISSMDNQTNRLEAEEESSGSDSSDGESGESESSRHEQDWDEPDAAKMKAVSWAKPNAAISTIPGLVSTVSSLPPLGRLRGAGTINA